MFNTSTVYLANYNSTADIVINQGGTDSGKTYSIIQVLYTIATSTKAPSEDPIITILSESVPNLKKGAWRTARTILTNNEILQRYVSDVNEGDRIIRFKSGWVMEFISVIDEQNAKQGKRQYLFVNEANGISWQIFWQMAKRTRVKTFIDYNPSAPFWPHEKLIGTVPEGNDLFAKVQLIISDHRHNPFLSKQDHDKTENIKDTELWRVYARGLTGNLSGLIYPSWRQIDDKDMPWESAEVKIGAVDFGYTNDPTACVVLLKIGKTFYVHELCYEPSMPSSQIVSLFKSVGIKGEKPVYCEHDRDMIRELRLKGLMAIPARKGPNSLASGIHKVNEFSICYTASSKNIDLERKKYMWIKDSVTGKFINEPSAGDDHLLDAIRYGIYTHMYRVV